MPDKSGLDQGYSVTGGVFERSEMADLLTELDQAEIARTKADGENSSGHPVFLLTC